MNIGIYGNIKFFMRTLYKSFFAFRNACIRILYIYIITSYVCNGFFLSPSSSSTTMTEAILAARRAATMAKELAWATAEKEE